MSRLTGNARHRINWRGKCVLQVEYWEQEYRAPHYRAHWRDAKAQDLVDIAQGKIQEERPSIGRPLPPSPPPKPIGLRNTVIDGGCP